MVATLSSTGILRACFKMAVGGKKSLGQMLIQSGKIEEEQLAIALDKHQEKPGYIGTVFLTKMEKKLGRNFYKNGQI